MPRKHLFPIVVLLTAALVAGLLAVSRTVALGRPANAATASDPAIAFRLKKLDRFEESLRRQLVQATATRPATVTTVYRNAPSVTSAPSHSYENEYEEAGRDD
jgi:hypothetical protein